MNKNILIVFILEYLKQNIHFKCAIHENGKRFLFPEVMKIVSKGILYMFLL